jgi:hypothetical protein
MNGRDLNARKNTTMAVTDPTIERPPQTARLLEGKVTIVPGASRGIGGAAARAFAAVNPAQTARARKTGRGRR